MKVMNLSIGLSIFIFASYNMISSSNAQAVSEKPDIQSVRSAYGDWVLHCTKPTNSVAGDETCEVSQSINAKDQSVIVAKLALGRLKPKEPLKVILVLPVSITFPSTPRVSADAKLVDGLNLIWRRCLPIGCYADAVISDDQLRRWKSNAAMGRIHAKDGLGREINIDFSFRGFSQAVESLSK